MEGDERFPLREKLFSSSSNLSSSFIIFSSSTLSSVRLDYSRRLRDRRITQVQVGIFCTLRQSTAGKLKQQIDLSRSLIKEFEHLHRRDLLARAKSNLRYPQSTNIYYNCRRKQQIQDDAPNSCRSFPLP